MRIIITEGSILETNVGMPRARQDHCPWRGKVEEQILGRREAELQQELQSRGDHKKHRDKSPGQVLQCLLKGRAALQVLNRGDWDGGEATAGSLMSPVKAAHHKDRDEEPLQQS